MDNLQLEHALCTDKYAQRYFIGVFPANGLPRWPVPWPCALVITAKSVPSFGLNHWLGLYITPDGEGEVFDSLGHPPRHPLVRAFIRRNTVRVLYNRARVQAFDSSTCGHHVLFFLLHRCRGLHPDYIVQNFYPDLKINDAIVEDFIRPLLIPAADILFL